MQVDGKEIIKFFIGWQGVYSIQPSIEFKELDIMSCKPGLAFCNYGI